MRVFAYDLDDGENSRLSYNFSENGLFSKYFRIDKETGVVYLQEPLLGVSLDVLIFSHSSIPNMFCFRKKIPSSLM